MPDRRTFLQRAAALPVIGSLLPKAALNAGPKNRDYFSELGVRTFINAAGTYTTKWDTINGGGALLDAVA